MFVPLYYVKTHRLRCPSRKKLSLVRDILEFTIYKQLQDTKMISSTFAYLDTMFLNIQTNVGYSVNSAITHLFYLLICLLTWWDTVKLIQEVMYSFRTGFIHTMVQHLLQTVVVELWPLLIVAAKPKSKKSRTSLTASCSYTSWSNRHDSRFPKKNQLSWTSNYVRTRNRNRNKETVMLHLRLDIKQQFNNNTSIFIVQMCVCRETSTKNYEVIIPSVPSPYWHWQTP